MEPDGPPCQVGAEMPEKAHTWTRQRLQTGQQGGPPGRVGAESQEKDHTWTGQRPQTGLQGGPPYRVGAEMPEKDHTWTGQRLQTGQQGGPPCRVGAEMPEKAHTWTRQQGTGRGSKPRPGKAGQFPANHYLCGMIATLLSILLCFTTPMTGGSSRNLSPETTTTCLGKKLCRENGPQPRPTIVLHPHEEVACRCEKSSPHEEVACRCGKSSPHEEAACHKEAARPDGKRFPEDVNIQEAAHPEQATPDGKDCLEGYRKVFLAGTIDGGDSVDWQAEAEKFFISRGGWAVFNPRQKEWHPERPGEMDYQVNWELSHLEQADAILMYFADGSKSPITLLELGLHARSGKLRVVCTEKFYRYDNVRITCERYGIPVFTTLQEALKNICEQ